jgi:hypothetical protein
MSAFTFTAPVITDEDEAAEWAAMTEEERANIRADMFGHKVGDAATAAPDQKAQDRPSIQNGLRIMIDAIHASSESDKEAYLEAVRQCSPELLHKECNLEHFLICEEYDPWAAAQRVLRYWSLRREFFGPHLCYQPLTLQGAMKEDVEYLQKGFVYPLFPDSHGRPVVFYDRIRATKRVAPRQIVSRCLFYVCCLAAAELYEQNHQKQDSMSDPAPDQHQGLVFLVNCRVRTAWD